MNLPIWIFSSVITVCFGSKNQIPDAPSDETECSGRMNYLSDVNLATKIILPPPLTGKWVSERCEIRTGPQYLLRSYTFYPNNTFYLLQFFYTDDSCSSITHAVSAKGVYKYKDSLPAKLLYKVDRVSVTFHDLQYINDLPSMIGDECTQTIGKNWKPFREYVIYEHFRKLKDTEDDGNVEPYRSTRAYAKNTKSWDYDMRCLSSMNISFDELYLLRVQQRPANDDKNSRYELLFGACHPYHEKKRKASLLKFQLPLILLNETNNHCPVCTIVSTCTHMFVPHLTAKATLPLFFNGEWVSQMCEARSMGLYTIRTYRFNHYLTEWEMETEYYSNYVCSNLLMVHNTMGHYYQGSISTIVSGATEIDFQIEKSYLTITDQTILDTIENDFLCGIPYYWKMNVKKEIPAKQGCSSLALVNPEVRYDIIKLDVDYDGSYILLLGDEGSVDTEKNELERPTAYDYPLVQCSAEPQTFAELSPETTPSKAHWIRYDIYIISILILIKI